MPVQKRIQARDLMWSIDFIKAAHANLGKGVTVTRFVLGDDEKDSMEFEIVVTKIGKNRVPRTTSAPAAKGAS